MRPSYSVSDGHLVFNTMAIPENTVIHGDCITVMAGLPAESVDFVLTDPPYICNYRDRQGRTIANDTNGDWLEPAFREIYRQKKGKRSYGGLPKLCARSLIRHYNLTFPNQHLVV